MLEEHEAAAARRAVHPVTFAPTSTPNAWSVRRGQLRLGTLYRSTGGIWTLEDTHGGRVGYSSGIKAMLAAGDPGHT